MKVCVLISTYNGEKFLEEQIASLLIQENVEVQIVVRDDGSTDASLQILEHYERMGCISLIRGENIGWKNSFRELIYNSPIADYYAFCDQDDIWMKDKLAVAVGKLEAMDKTTPNLYGSNLNYYIDGIDKGLVKKNIPPTVFPASLARNLTAGCTMVFNKVLRDLIYENPSYIDFPHDYWLYLVASILGNVYYDQESHILYRQHTANQIGATLTRFDKWKARFEDVRILFRPQGRQVAALELLRLYSDLLTDDKRKIVEKIAYYNESFRRKLELLFDRDFSMGTWDSNFGLRLRILIGSI